MVCVLTSHKVDELLFLFHSLHILLQTSEVTLMVAGMEPGQAIHGMKTEVHSRILGVKFKTWKYKSLGTRPNSKGDTKLQKHGFGGSHLSSFASRVLLPGSSMTPSLMLVLYSSQNFS